MALEKLSVKSIPDLNSNKRRNRVEIKSEGTLDCFQFSTNVNNAERTFFGRSSHKSI